MATAIRSPRSHVTETECQAEQTSITPEAFDASTRTTRIIYPFYPTLARAAFIADSDDQPSKPSRGPISITRRE